MTSFHSLRALKSLALILTAPLWVACSDGTTAPTLRENVVISAVTQPDAAIVSATCSSWSGSDVAPSRCYQGRRVNLLNNKLLLTQYAVTLDQRWYALSSQTRNTIIWAATTCGLAATGAASLASGVGFIAGAGIWALSTGGPLCVSKAVPAAIQNAFAFGQWLAAWTYWQGQTSTVSTLTSELAAWRSTVRYSPVTVNLSFTTTGTPATATLSGVCASTLASSRYPMSVYVQSGTTTVNYAVSCVNGRWSRTGTPFASSKEYSIVAVVYPTNAPSVVSSVIDRGL